MRRVIIDPYILLVFRQISVLAFASYEGPPCQAGEHDWHPRNAGGSICAPACHGSDARCPDPGLGALPKCNLEGSKYCELQCTGDSDCPNGAMCRMDEHHHICTYLSPAPSPPTPPPTPLPKATWPTFVSLDVLKADPWATYYQAVYGSLPTWSSFPLKTEDIWMLYDLQLVQAKVKTAPTSVGTCPTANPPAGQRYNVNSDYQPRYSSFIWHPYPYSRLPGNSWQEIFHMADPFGDEHFGAWLTYTPGSGIYINLGKTIAFAEHQDAYKHFGVTTGDLNEELSKAAAAQGYDTVQFLAHVDHINYQCDTKNTGNTGLDYMGLEILACKLVGTYACTVLSGAPSSIKAGWQASRACVCDNKESFINCKGVPSLDEVTIYNNASHMPQLIFL